MAEYHPNRRAAHVFEFLVLLILCLIFGQVSYGKFNRSAAEMLNAGTDPRLMVVDLVSLAKLAQSTGVAHQVQFVANDDGTITGYTAACRSEFGDPWPVLRTRTFPAGVQVSSTVPCIEFASDGTSTHACEVSFCERGRSWLVDLSEGTGDLRLTESGTADRERVDQR